MGFFKNIFKSGSLSEMLDISALKVDMHSHLIPGIDDGVSDIETSVFIIRRLKELGYEKIITTPHIMADMYQNEPSDILSGLEEVKKALVSQNINIEVAAAAEYCLDDGFDAHLKSGNILTLKDNFILVELPYFLPPPDLYDKIFELQINNYKVVIAHPERYMYWYDDFSKFEDLKSRGVYFQVNMISLSGNYSIQAKKLAEKLIENNMIDFMGSDLHNNAYLDYFQKSLYLPALHKLVNSGEIKNHLLL